MIKLGSYNICLLDLVTDSKTGKFSTTKIWQHIGFSIMSKIMLTHQSVDWELLVAYGAIVGGSYVASMLIKYKYGVQNANPSVPES